MSTTPNTSAMSPTLPADPVDRHAHVPTQIGESDRGPPVDTQVMNNFSLTILGPEARPGRIRKPAQSLDPDAKRLRYDAGKRSVLMLSHDFSFGRSAASL